MEIKSTLQSLTQGSVMYESVLFDYAAKPLYHQGGHLYVDRGMWDPSPSLDQSLNSFDTAEPYFHFNVSQIPNSFSTSPSYSFMTLVTAHSLYKHDTCIWQASRSFFFF